jgi:RNA polymerase primary sigma factor
VPNTLRSRTPFEMYLSEIDKTPLLSAEEERELALRVQAGDPAARDRLVRANLRLVVSLARRYAGKGLPLEDLVAEGNMGLLRAAEGFDPAAGTRFSTYASYWIKQSARRALNRDGTTVRLPSYVTALVGNWYRADAQLHRELGRPATEEEVVAHLRLSRGQLRAVRKAMRVLSSARQSDEDGGGPLDRVASAGGSFPAEELAGAEEVRKAVGSLSSLTEREASVLRLRFGLDGGNPATLKEIGERLGYTRERVRQIERDALGKLKMCVAA